MSCEEKIRTRICECMDNDKVLEMGIQEDFRGVGINSVIFIKIIIRLELEFDFVFPETKMLLEEINTINDLCEIVSQNT